MRIAILTSGILPIPAVQGGAVETLVDSYLAYNRKHRLHDITVYSIGSKDIPAGYGDDSNHYVFIDTSSTAAKIRKHIFRHTHKDCYYYFGIEYYLHEALKHIRRNRYDIIIIENRPGFALKTPHDNGARLVLHLHNDFLNTATRCGREIFSRLSRIVCVSDYISGVVRQIEPDSSKVVTVHNGIDTGAFCRKADTGISRKQLGLAESDFILIFSGRITREKGVAELIEAMLLLHNHHDIKLMILGSSFFGNATGGDQFIEALKAKALPIKDRIIFTGFIPHREMPSYLALADAAIIPSVWHDPFPTTVLEAQAMGLPIITTSQGGIPEEVSEDNAIIVKASGNLSNALSTAILELYSSPARRAAMGKAAAVRAQLFTEERYAEAFFHALDDIPD